MAEAGASRGGAAGAALASARREWEEGQRRLERAAGDPATGERLHAQVEAVTEELQRRLGGPYTLAELAGEYAEAERWAREAVAERAPSPGWERQLADVQAAAFNLYSRGAVDYEP